MCCNIAIKVIYYRLFGDGFHFRYFTCPLFFTNFLSKKSGQNTWNFLLLLFLCCACNRKLTTSLTLDKYLMESQEREEKKKPFNHRTVLIVIALAYYDSNRKLHTKFFLFFAIHSNKIHCTIILCGAYAISVVFERISKNELERKEIWKVKQKSNDWTEQHDVVREREKERAAATTRVKRNYEQKNNTKTKTTCTTIY